jgi:two-component sensor histidine kinase
MTAALNLRRTEAPSTPARKRSSRIPRFECELNDGACPVTGLRAALIREAQLLTEKDLLIEQQAILSREADHRLLNNLQMVSSLLSMQSRTSQNVEAASALTLAAARVATIGRIHRLLHSKDGVQTVAFKQFVEALCHDVSMMLTVEGEIAHVIEVEGAELQLPTAVGIPLGFVVNELITNALKCGAGAIKVTLEHDLRKGLALTVQNDGPALSRDFDPAVGTGLGMRIIRSFVAKIGGELLFGEGAGGCGARFTVLFSAQ